jgi:hypothetical protein
MRFTSFARTLHLPSISPTQGALLGSGSFLVILGTMMTSLTKQYYQAFLAQGFCTGLDAGMMFVPSIAVMSTYRAL